jgi:hypothetical protein
MPVLLVGLVNRTKSLVGRAQAGRGCCSRAGTCCACCASARCSAVVSTPLFRAGAWVVLAASLLAALIAPMLGGLAPLQFAHDFVVFAYTLGLARLFLMLSALDVGSAFEGMGAAREASFSAFIEPALFLLASARPLMAPARPALPAWWGTGRLTRSFGWLVAPVPSWCCSSCCRPKRRACRWTTR